MTRDPRITLNARQQELLDWVQRDGFVTVEDLATHFDVTPQTIRRDKTGSNPALRRWQILI